MPYLCSSSKRADLTTLPASTKANLSNLSFTHSLPEMKDKYFGKVGTTERDEYELCMDVLGKMIKTIR